jgi:conjugal transfer ATP-binding protein TraC
MRAGNLLNEIPAWEVLDGVMINQNGIAEVGVRFRPRASLTQNAENLERLEMGLQTILRELVPQGQRLRLLVQCKPGGWEHLEPYRETPVRHPALGLLRQGRMRQAAELETAGKLLAWDFVLTLTVGRERLGTLPFLPILLLSKVFPKLANRGFVTFDRESLLELLQQAREKRGELVAALKNLGWHAEAMDSNAVQRLTFEYLNPAQSAVNLPEYEPTKARYPESETTRDHRIAPSSLRSRLAKVDIVNADLHQLRLGTDTVRILAMHARPEASRFGMANALLCMKGRGWYIADFVHEPQQVVADRLSEQERSYDGLMKSGMQLVDANASVAAVALRDFNRARMQTGQHIYTVAAQIHLIDTDEKRLGERVSDALSTTSEVPGSPFKVCGYNIWKPFHLALPFCGGRLESAIIVRDKNAVAFLPTEGPLETGMNPVSLFHSTWGTIIPIDLDDRNLPNRNMLIVGQSGSGKSVVGQLLASDELNHQKITYTIIEKGSSFAGFIAALGDEAVRIPLDPTEFSINLLDLPPDTVEPGAEKLSSVTTLIKNMILKPSETDDAIISAVLGAAVSQTYARKTVQRKVGDAYVRVYQEALLSDVRDTLSRMEEAGDLKMTGKLRDVADDLAVRLGDWTGNTAKGGFFDRPTSIPFVDKRVVLYDTSPLEAYKEIKSTAIMVMAQLIAERWKDDRETIKKVVVDEAHDIAKMASGFDFLDDHQRRCRAANGAQVLISQTLSEFKRVMPDGNSKSLLENISIFWVFPVASTEFNELRSHANMSEEALEMIPVLKSDAGQYSEAIFWAKFRSGAAGAKLRIRLSSADRWMFSSDAYDDTRRAKVIARRGGDVIEGVRELAGMKEEVVA